MLAGKTTFKARHARYKHSVFFQRSILRILAIIIPLHVSFVSNLLDAFSNVLSPRDFTTFFFDLSAILHISNLFINIFKEPGSKIQTVLLGDSLGGLRYFTKFFINKY